MAKITVLFVEKRGAAGVVREVDNRSYEAQSALVGGLLESVALPTGHTLWCNEEGLLLGLPFTLVVECGVGEGRTPFAEQLTGLPFARRYPAPIHGPFYVSGPEDGDGYSKGLRARDLPVLAEHLGIEIAQEAVR